MQAGDRQDMGHADEPGLGLEFRIQAAPVAQQERPCQGRLVAGPSLETARDGLAQFPQCATQSGTGSRLPVHDLHRAHRAGIDGPGP